MAYRRALRRTQREVDAARMEAPVETGAVPATGYDAMSYADIRTLAMSYGISGRQTKEALIAALEEIGVTR